MRASLKKHGKLSSPEIKIGIKKHKIALDKWKLLVAN